MTNDDRKEVIKKNELRTEEIAHMIGEGGMGADKYYNIKKKVAVITPARTEKTAAPKNKDE